MQKSKVKNQKLEVKVRSQKSFSSAFALKTSLLFSFILFFLYTFIPVPSARAVTLQSDQSGLTRGAAMSTLNNGLVGYWTFNNQDMNWKTGTASRYLRQRQHRHH